MPTLEIAVSVPLQIEPKDHLDEACSRDEVLDYEVVVHKEHVKYLHVC